MRLKQPGETRSALSTEADSQMTLEERYSDNPWLLEFYEEGLLESGWAGELDDVELDYIKSNLRQSPSLRRRWGFRPSAKRLSEDRIRAVAMNGVSRKRG